MTEYARSFRPLGPRAAYSETEYRVQTCPFCWPQVGAIYATFALCIVSFLLFLAGVGNRQKPGPLYSLDNKIAVLLMFVSAAWPLVASYVLQALAKRRTGWEPKSIIDDPAIMTAIEETARLMKQHETKHPENSSD